MRYPEMKMKKEGLEIRGGKKWMSQHDWV